MTSIDLNADLGEGMGTDEDLLDIVSSASIACGGHAGDAVTIRHILKICKARGVLAGAHPGYADPKRFGRFRVVMPLDELLGQIRSQLFLVRFIADEVGVPLSYVKLHGALANQTAEELAFAVGMFHSDGFEGNRASGPQLRKSVEIGADDGGNAWIAAGRLVVAHQHDRGAVAQDLDIARHDGIRHQRERRRAGEDIPDILQPHAHAVEPR